MTLPHNFRLSGLLAGSPSAVVFYIAEMRVSPKPLLKFRG